MDNNPDNSPNSDSTPEASSTPAYDIEPSTDANATQATPDAGDSVTPSVSTENPVPDTSPFGPPIENLGTQPDFGSSDSVVNATTPSVSPSDGMSAKPISDVMTPSSSPSSANLSEPANDTPSPEPAVVAGATTAPMMETAKSKRDGKKTVIKLPKQKGGKKGLIITIVVLLVLIAAAVGGYFYVKTSADNAADDYTASVKTYLSQVYNAASATGTADPGVVKSSIDSISKPILEKPLLSDIEFVSQKHADATNLNGQVNSHVSALTSTLMELGDVYAFSTEYDTLSQQATTTSSKVTEDSTKAETLAMFDDYMVVLEKIKSLVSDAVLPGDLSDAQTSLSTALDAEIAALKDEIAKFTADDTDGYEAAKIAFNTASTDEATAYSLVKTYTDTIPAKVQAAAELLKVYADSVK